MAVNPQKFLPSGKTGGALVKASKNLVKSSTIISLSENSIKNIGVIKVKVIEVESILKGTLALQKKQLDNKKRASSQSRREKIESNLETKPKAEKGDVKIPKVPGMGFLDWVKNFIGKIILGYFAVRMIDHLPKLIPFVKVIGGAADFIINLGGKILDGLVTFIDWGYKAYDATRGFVKNLFGKDGAKQFDQLAGLLNQFLNLVIIAGMVSAGSGGGGGSGRGGGGARTRPGQGGRPRVTTSGGGRAGGIDLRNPFRQRPQITTGRGGAPSFRLPGSGARVTTGGGRGGFGIGRFFSGLKIPKLPSGLTRVMGAASKSLGVITLIPLVFDVVGAIREGRYKDAARIIISGGLSMVVFELVLGTSGAAAVAEAVLSGGTLTPAAIATLIGGTALATGASVGTSAGSDILLKKLGLEDKPKGMAGGGITRGGKIQGYTRRTISTSKKGKYKRLITQKPGEVEISPGSDVGGEEKLFGLFPKPKLPGFMNPFGVIEKGGKELGKSDFFGPILAITAKILLGQKPSQSDYKNVGLGINLLISKGLQDGKLKGGVAAAFAEGGLVDPQTFAAISDGGDISDWVSASFKDATESNAQKTLREIQENLRLKREGNGTGTKPTSEGDVPTGTGSLTGNTNAEKVFNYLIGYGFTEQAAAGVIGNLMQESGVNPRSHQGGGGPGRGIMQWGTGAGSGGRWDALVAWASSSGKDPWTLDTQVEWMMKEMRSYGTLNRLKGLTNVRSATDIFEKEMEAAGTPMMENRYRFAADALASFGKGRAGGGNFTGGGLGSGYGSGGVKIAGDLGDYLKANRSQIGITGSIHQHPRHPGQFRRSYFSYHNLNRALDIGGYGPNHPSSGGRDEQAPVIRALLDWNKRNGYTPVEIIHGSPTFRGLGTYESSPNAAHANHVHVAYKKGGETLGYPHLASIAENGPEIVIDNDSAYSSPEVKNMLLAINQATGYKGVMKAIQQYAPYDALAPQMIFIPESSGGGYDGDQGESAVSVLISGEEGSNPMDVLYKGG